MNKTKEWRNPVEDRGTGTPAGVIAQTAANIYEGRMRRDLDASHGAESRHRVLTGYYGWSAEAALEFERYLASMTAAESKRARAYAKAHFDAAAFQSYCKELEARARRAKGAA